MGLTNVWKYGLRWPLKKSFITDMNYSLVKKIVYGSRNYKSTPSVSFFRDWSKKKRHILFSRKGYQGALLLQLPAIMQCMSSRHFCHRLNMQQWRALLCLFTSCFLIFFFTLFSKIYFRCRDTQIIMTNKLWVVMSLIWQSVLATMSSHGFLFYEGCHDNCSFTTSFFFSFFKKKLLYNEGIIKCS